MSTNISNVREAVHPTGNLALRYPETLTNLFANRLARVLVQSGKCAESYQLHCHPYREIWRERVLFPEMCNENLLRFFDFALKHLHELGMIQSRGRRAGNMRGREGNEVRGIRVSERADCVCELIRHCRPDRNLDSINCLHHE